MAVRTCPPGMSVPKSLTVSPLAFRPNSFDSEPALLASHKHPFSGRSRIMGKGAYHSSMIATMSRVANS